jgi:signal transduction histidine kinase
MTDMREIKSLLKVEEDLKKLNKTKDEFISIVGHELRTPLTAIKGYLSMILDGDFGVISSPIKQSLMHSYESTNRLIELVNDMLSISKIESGNMTYYIDNFRAAPILKAVYQDLIIEAEIRKLVLILDVKENVQDVLIRVDENKLKQVLINLATNALKFTQEGSITLQLERRDNMLLFSVIDTGEGIPSDKIDILFEKFTQVE